MFISASERDVRDDLRGKDAELIPGLPEDAEGNGRRRSAAIADELAARARQTDAGVTFIEDAEIGPRAAGRAPSSGSAFEVRSLAFRRKHLALRNGSAIGASAV